MPTEKFKLKAEREDLVKESEGITAKAHDGPLSEEDSKRFDEIEGKVKALDARIDILRKQEAMSEGQAKLADWMTGDGTAPTGENGTPKVEVKHNFEDDPKKGFKTPREFLMSVMGASRRGGPVSDVRLRAVAVPDGLAKMYATVGSDEQSGAHDPYGGFMVPDGFSPDLLSLEPEEDPTSGTFKVPMANPIVRFPARVDKDHSSSVSGGLTVTRRPEMAAGTASRMEVEQITLEAFMLIGLSYATEEILTDSPISFIAVLERGFSDEMNATLIKERIRGTGVGEFLGVLNCGALISVAKETSQTADTLKGINIVKMRSRAYRYSQCVWIANHDTYPELSGIHIAGTNSDNMMFQPSMRDDRPDTLLGRPIYFSEYASTIGDLGDIMLVNWNEYLEGLLQPLQSAESIHVRFSNHERTFKFTLRNAGQPWWRSALTPQESSTTLSPFVALAERA